MSPAPPSDLASSARSGARHASLASATTAVLQVLQIALLARILTPTDFAVAAVASVAASLLAFYADFGLSGAIVHYHQASASQLSTLYWLNLGVGFALAIGLFAAAPLAAHFYGNAELEGTLKLLSLSIVMAAFAGQYRAILQKRFAFGVLALANASSAVITCTVSVVAALLGLGVYSIALGVVAGGVTSAAIVVVAGSRVYRPERYFRLAEVGPFLRFGLYQVAERTLDFLNTQIDSLILGKLVGMTDLGRYAPIKALCTKPVALINPVLTGVAFPIMSATQQDRVRVARIYLLQVRAVASLTAPIYFFGILQAPAIIGLLLGNQWSSSADVFRLLALYGLLVSIGNPVGSLLLATGRAKRSFYWNLASALLVPLATICVAPFGIAHIAATMTALQLVLLIPGWRYLIWPSCGASLKSYLWSFTRPVSIAAVATLLAWPVTMAMSSPWGSLLVTGVLGLALYVTLSWIFNRTIVTLIYHTVARRPFALYDSPHADTAD
ncbi:MOP flippase family protein [Dyella sp. ASV21]|uniref:MOP flippase family protein n=1 Tax=Dyella sp. ASV21 TaxID=2795114 RepID=UPI0018EC1CB1|nr:MOP flippase family protein [Dyella sp. ASV21]